MKTYTDKTPPHYEYALLDPRPGADNSLWQQRQQDMFGIEVTVPALARMCKHGNCDPQHTEAWGNARCAIEAAMTMKPPRRRAVLATVRADLDSVGAMAVLTIRKGLIESDSDDDVTTEPGFQDRVDRIIKADTFNNGPWPGTRPLPSEDEWDREEGFLGGIAAAVADHRETLTTRVIWMDSWLRTGRVRSDYHEKAYAEYISMVRALEQGKVGILTFRVSDAMLAVVTSQHRWGLGIGYRTAPVVIAINPEFIFQGGEKHRKVTIAQYRAEYFDADELKAHLNELEPGWGGSNTIIGSPQGVSTELNDDAIRFAVIHAMKKVA